MLAITYIYTKITDGVLFFSAFIIAFISSCAAFLLWLKKNKNPFENFLVLLTFILFNTLFVYFGPVTIDRSLSSFIYFYAVENKTISASKIYNEEYFKPYIQRRFDDGVKIGFLKCDNSGLCTPKLKTKITYYSLCPIAKITGTLGEYKEFKKMMDDRKYINNMPADN